MPRQAGVLLPLFSLRSAGDWGVGEIPDLVPFARWCAGAGFSVERRWLDAEERFSLQLLRPSST